MYSKIYSYTVVILNNKFYHSTVDLNTFIVVIFIGKIQLTYTMTNPEDFVRLYSSLR